VPHSPLDLADAFIRAGELDDALAALSAQLAAQPDDTGARRLRAAVLLRLGDRASLHSALDDLAALPSITPDDLAQQSVISERLGDGDGALAAARQALALRPNDERLAERLAGLLAAQGELTAALDVVRAQPRTWRWLEREGDLLAQANDNVTAAARYGLVLALLETAFPDDNPFAVGLRAAVLLKRAETFRRLDDTANATNCLDAAAALSPGEPLLPFVRGLLLAQSGDDAGALALCAPAYAAANAPLQAEMRRALASDPRFGLLAARLDA
jgi:tetratricopeptide (TPR) repeat protein